MGKTSATIKLIQVLAARNDYVKTNELAELIETNPRNIKEYIKEIEECGYVIESQLGFYGGYKLKKSSMLPSLKMSSDEKKLIKNALSYVYNSPDFEQKAELEGLIGRIVSSNELNDDVTPLSISDRFPLLMPKEDLQKRYGMLHEAIDSQTKVSISYLSSKGTTKEHVIHPYKLFVFNGIWFVLAYNETVDDFGYFKLNRIESYLPTRNHFTIMKTFNESDYLDEYGMKKNGEYFHVSLEFDGLTTAISERSYGKNQVITELDDNRIIFECDMQNKDMIKSFVLSFGSKCRVLEPEWLKEDLLEELTKMIESI